MLMVIAVSVFAIVALVAAVGGFAWLVSAIALRQRRVVCPSCGARRLDTYDVVRATEVDDAGRRRRSSWSKHRCDCGAAYVRYNGGGLIAKQAFEAGSRVPLPHARVVRGAGA